MKILICGSRTFNDSRAIEEQLGTFEGIEGITIIHGGARGADSLAGNIAKKLGWKQLVFLPDWDLHGKCAGIVRNDLMLDQQPDLVMAFWDGKSRGTQHTIREATKRKIKVIIHYDKRNFNQSDPSKQDDAD
jgi:hypothetical protein